MNPERYYIGLSATFHDPAFAIVGPDGEVLFAEACERYLQDKRAFNATPDHFIRAAALVRKYCPPDAEIVVGVSWSEKMLLSSQLRALTETALLRPVIGPARKFLSDLADHQVWPYPALSALQAMMLSGLNQAGLNLKHNREFGSRVQIRRYDHHDCHAVYACHASNFDEAACAVIDGYGEDTSVAMFRWREGELERLEPDKSRRPGFGSLGVFYSQLCAACGFDPLKGEEWKVMGLAPYGRAQAADLELLRPMVSARGIGLELGCSPREHRRRLEKLREQQPPPGSSPDLRADLARAGQQVFGDVMSELLSNLYARCGSPRLVFGGGCALNSSYNGELLQRTPFESLFVPSAPSDDGNAVGAALLAWSEDAGGRRRANPHGILSPYLGTPVDRETLDNVLQFGGWPRVRQLGEGVVAATAEILAAGGIVGWMVGRAEFGPRALGHRSVLADPRSPAMKDIINARIKFREGFRPFAPSILHEAGPEYFEHYQESPYMERALRFRPEVRERVPAVVHVDGTGRAQSVRPELSPRYHALLTEFARRTEVPMLLNTSFNVMGKPIIHSVEDAFGVFLTSGLDALVIDDVLFEKQQPNGA